MQCRLTVCLMTTSHLAHVLPAGGLGLQDLEGGRLQGWFPGGTLVPPPQARAPGAPSVPLRSGRLSPQPPAAGPASLQQTGEARIPSESGLFHEQPLGFLVSTGWDLKISRLAIFRLFSSQFIMKDSFL